MTTFASLSTLLLFFLSLQQGCEMASAFWSLSSTVAKTIASQRIARPSKLFSTSSSRASASKLTDKVGSSNGSGDSSMVVALNVKIAVKPEHRDRMLQHLIYEAKETRQEPGGLQFMVGQDVDDPNVLYLHEQYHNRSAWDNHNDTPHFKAFGHLLEELDDPLTEPVAIQAYQCSHTPQSIDNSQLENAYCLNVESCIKPELMDDYVALMQSHQANSQAEDLCLQFDWGISLDDPYTIYIHEEYANKEGFEAHAASKHFARLLAYNQDNEPYSKPQVVQFFQSVRE